jgi:hypothetical protein
MCNGDEVRWRGSGGRCGVVGHERCSFNQIALRALILSEYSIPRLAQRGEAATKRIGVSPAKTQRPQRKETIFIRTWRSSRLSETNIRIRDVSYVGKFMQTAKTFKQYRKIRPRPYLAGGNVKAPNESSSKIRGLLGGMANPARISSRGSLACWKKSTSRSRSLLQAAPRARPRPCVRSPAGGR